ncbi:hypothetical protein ACHAW5_003261 [Stephanodiscus triporus]|uniref:MBD domain-containing protein n=1 Tax=Stephanodiscus triporus TaxID=2934178 RepID=A0ABD3NJQ2_9STRA
MPPRRRTDDDVVGSCEGERETPVAKAASGDGAARERRTDGKTVFSVERIGEIATTTTSSSSSARQDVAADEGKTKRGGRKKDGRDASRGGDRRAAIDAADGGGGAEKSADGVRREGVAESVVPPRSESSGEPSRRTDGEAVTWKDVWAAMRRSGWSWKGGSGLMTDYYYIKPKCRVHGGAPGRDYFVRVEDVMEFARDVYGWHEASSSSREELFARIEDHARHCGERVPPLLGADGETTKLGDPYEPWKGVWEKMLRSGWTWRCGSGLMLDYYYIKPGSKIGGGVEGQDYFVRVEDVQKFAARNYGWRGGGGVKSSAPVINCANGDPGEDIDEEWESDDADDTKKKGSEGLPDGWTRRRVPRKSGDKSDPYWFSPEQAYKFNSISHVRQFLACLEEACGDEVVAYDSFCKMRSSKSTGVNDVAVHDWNNSKGKKRKGKSLAAATRPTLPVPSVIDVFYKNKNVGAHEVQKETRPRVEKCEKKPARTKDVRAEEDTSDVENDRQEPTTLDDADGESTFSQSGFRTKNLFLDECADEDVPPLTREIDPNEPWRYAWEKMLGSGWTWKIGSGLMTDYYYVKPGRRVKGGVKGRDYFISEEDVRRFATRNYGWRGSGGCVKQNAAAGGGVGGRKRSNSTVNNIVSENKRQKGEVKEVATTSSSIDASSRSQPPVDPFKKRALWQALQKEGWKAVSAGRYNKLHDWYYVRPNCNPGDGTSKLGVDYFLSEDAAIEFAERSANMTSDPIENDNEAQLLNVTNQAVTVPFNGVKSNEKHQVRGRMHEINHLLISSKTAGSETPAGLLNTPPDCRTKPQDPANPLPASAESHSSTSRQDSYEWSSLWPLLETAGWQIMKAGKYNPLHDWYYVRPRKDPGNEECKLGSDFFTSVNDVIEFVKLEDKNESAGKLDFKSRKSMGAMLERFEEEAKAWT